jgi:ribosomal-protein-serine acetyltransferase
MKPHLKINENLKLQQPDLVYSTALFELVNNNRLYLEKWLPWVSDTKSIEDSQAFLKNAIRFSKGGQQLHTLIIYENELVGLVGFNTIRKAHQKAEIGYWIAENMQGKGIVTKAVHRLVHYGFHQMNLNRVIIQVNTENTASQNVARRLNFTYEGTLRQSMKVNNTFVDIQIYGLLKSEFGDL